MAGPGSPSGSKSGAPSGAELRRLMEGNQQVARPTTSTPAMPTGSMFGGTPTQSTTPAAPRTTRPRTTTAPTPSAPAAPPAATPPTGAEAPLTPETPRWEPTPAPSPDGTPAPGTPPEGGAAPTPAPTSGTPENRRLFSQLAQLATEAGLGSLFSMDASGNPSGWLWDKILNNTISDATFDFEIEQTDAFKQRYPAVAWLRQENAAGRTSVPATPATVRKWENDVRDMMRQANLPPEFYDDNVSDLQGLMMRGISAVELEQRIGQSWSRVQSADPAIRQAFTDFYGVGNGDSALAAFFLDPANMTQNLERMSKAAYTAGRGMQAGIGLSRAAAERVATMTTSDTQIEQGIGQLAQYSSLFDEGVTESEDLNIDTTGVDAAFSGNVDAQAALERRLIGRQANRGMGSGGAVQTQRGLIGTGNA